MPVGWKGGHVFDVDKSMFFYHADMGEKLGQWVLPRPQSAVENCTVHNYNMSRCTADGRSPSGAITRPAPGRSRGVGRKAARGRRH